MRGSKFYTKLCLVFVTILCLGVVGGVFLTPAKISKVRAEDTTKYIHEACSQRYDDDIVFSVEQVYYNYDNRATQLFVDSGKTLQTTNILGYDNQSNYFLNYGGTNENISKEIIHSGEYAMLDDKAFRTAYTEAGSVSLRQGIMITLGGYVFDDAGSIHTNGDVEKTINDPDNPGSTVDVFYSSRLQSINIELKKNGEVFTGNESDGSASLRTYNGGLYFDFVYFLSANKDNEGYYEINFTYTKEDGKSQSHSFNFYILLLSQYNGTVKVNEQNYTMAPTFEHVNSYANTHSATSTGKDKQYPVLTYDYKHYDMKYTYTHNDLVENVEVLYEQDPNNGVEQLRVITEINGAKSSNIYSCKDFSSSNNIVSFLFADIGKYEFEFNFVYYYNGVRLIVANKTVPGQTLNITGYELKYAKTGFASSSLKCLDIVVNGTMVVPVNGYQNNKVEADESLELGYMYNFVEPETTDAGIKKSGKVKKLQTADVTTTEEYFDSTGTRTTTAGETIKTLTFNDVGKFCVPETSDFIDTDQDSLWFNLNDKYALDESFYIYSPVKFVNDTAYDQIAFKKETTFTTTGYYFAVVKYAVENNKYPQYYAFKITSGVANVQLFKEVENATDERMYSHQYTNTDVYATWNDPTTFSSSQTATLYHTRQGYSNLYESKASLLSYADGRANVSLTSEIYNKESKITNSGSYLLEVKVNGSDARAYYYFTIDKEDISGIDALAVSSASIGTSTIYNVARDASNNPIVYTSNVAIDKPFTMWWNDKPSGATISGSYTYTPISSQKTDLENLQGTSGGEEYLWMVGDYKLGNTSSKISLEKPATKLSTVNAENVLTKQGIYWFELKDEAGNVMNYMMIIDNTKSQISATTEDGTKVVSGEMLAGSVNIEWGTHKAIYLNNVNVTNSVTEKIYNKFYNASDIKYYEGTNANINSVKNFIREVNDTSGQHLYLVVENAKAMISISPSGQVVTINRGDKSLTHNNGCIKLNNYHNIKIDLSDTETIYSVEVFGQNQIDANKSDSKFVVVLNPDNSEGEVKSKADETIKDFNKVWSYNASYEEATFVRMFNSGQASNDGLFVFEWVNNEGTEYEVGRVYYEYYTLMTQEELNKYEDNKEDYKYYPYNSTPTTFNIYNADGSASNYVIDSNGTKTIYRSTVLNAGYVLYYDETGNLVSKNATLPGMYVITREYKTDTGNVNDSKTRKYTFFVDRNNIIDYSTSNVSDKTVGENIDIFSQEELRFDNFTQTVKEYKREELVDGQPVYVPYNIYLQSNRLPMQIRIPTGKYASLSNNEIVKTSNSRSGKLDFKVSFIDEYNILGQNTAEGKVMFPLFIDEDSLDVNNMIVYTDKGYIVYNLTLESLYNPTINSANISNYLNACQQKGTDWLSLPGIYVIEINDNVGNANQEGVVEAPNTMSICIEITHNKPLVDMYASQSALTNQNVDQAKLSDSNLQFDTNKAYIRYELPKEDASSFNAQIDSKYIYIERINNGNTELYYDSKTNSGVINTDSQFEGIYYIQELSDKIIVWLDTGLKLEGGKIVDYAEYVYKVKVRYLLGENDKYKNSYIYNSLNINGGIKSQEQYYESVITVNIDRTPIIETLENSSINQTKFFEEYITNYSDSDYQASGKLNSKIYNIVSFRGQDGEDYYALVNTLYYYYVGKGEYEQAENSMYAIRVTDSDIIQGNGSLYFRKMYKDASNEQNRMALLPICDRYYGNTTGFETFSKTRTGDFKSGVGVTVKTWANVLDLSTNGYGYYEIIELDSSGNMTQYLIYVNKSGEDNTAEISFSDPSYTYKATFTLGNGGEEPKIELKETNDAFENLATQFALIPYSSVKDMFGLEYSRRNEISSVDNVVKDWFFKINISNALGRNHTYFLNKNNIELAKYIDEIMSEYSDQNYTLTLTDRHYNELSLNIDVLSQMYNLNTSNFNAKLKENGNYWYISPSDLNFDIVNGGKYYVSTIELTDLTDEENPKFTFELDKDGKIIKINGEEQSVSMGVNITNNIGGAEIVLVPDHEYTAILTDCAMKTYEPIKIYAYSAGDKKDSSINPIGEYSCINDIYYTANPVIVKYNKNIYTEISIEVYKDGLFVGTYNSGFSYEDTITVELESESTTSKNNVLTFNPYKLAGGLNQTGAVVEFKLNLIYNNNTDRSYNIVLDNRSPMFSLVNTSGEDRTNIITVDYKNTTDSNADLSLTANKLFDIIPSLTLSETVVLGWGDFDPAIYANNTGAYYHAYLYLVEFETRTDYTITNLGTKTDTIKNISPKEGSLGRYVLVMALYNQEQDVLEGDKVSIPQNGLISYKAYAFNISSTANAMYEVQNGDGTVIENNALIKGSDLIAIVGKDAQSKQLLMTTFGFSEDSTQGDKYENFTKFKSQTIPLYMSIDGLYLVPNGDNGVSTKSHTYIISSQYTLNIYKVYSNVHFTYAAILKVEKADELVTSNADLNAIRFVSNDGSNLTTNLIKQNKFVSGVYGSIYFENFNRGGIPDTSTKELVLARKNRLYLEVWYKYTDDFDSKVKVGDFYGDTVYENNNPTDTSFVTFKTSGTYIVYLKDLAGNTRKWSNANGVETDYLTITILPEVIVSVNDEVPVDYNYYNGDVTVNVMFASSGYYDNGSIEISAYHNGGGTEYITSKGGRNNITNYTFTEYGTYRVIIKAEVNSEPIKKILVFSIINPNEARLALDFTQISKHDITKVVNTTTNVDVTEIFKELINEGYIYNKLITFDRLSKENAFGSTMGKQTFQVYYTVNDDILVPTRHQTFTFTVNNQTPSLHSSIEPGESTTKDITIKFNAQTIYRQVGECYLMLNDTVVLAINSDEAIDGTSTITIKNVGTYYVKLVTDSGRVITSFKVTVKEPLNTWSIVLIVGVVLVVVGIIVTFIILRTRMRVR